MSFSEGTIGEISLFAGNFAPRNWATCSGQILAIATNTALFSILGTTYGGNGQTTFALPDLRGRTAIGSGQGPGLTSIVLGEMAGVENVTLLSTNMPAHTHPLTANSTSTQVGSGVAAVGDTTTPENSYLALSPKIGSGPNATQLKTYATTAASPVKLAGSEVTTNTSGTNAVAGGSQPFGIRNPYLALTYCVALVGIFPSRN